jgi:hypothetical protein
MISISGSKFISESTPALVLVNIFKAVGLFHANKHDIQRLVVSFMFDVSSRITEKYAVLHASCEENDPRRYQGVGQLYWSKKDRSELGVRSYVLLALVLVDVFSFSSLNKIVFWQTKSSSNRIIITLSTEARIKVKLL